MIEVRVRINIVLVAISASYLTLGLANDEVASSLWWVYAIVSGAFSAANLFLANRGSHR